MLSSTAAHAQADGPRAFQIIPADTRVLSAYGMFLRGNQTADPGSVIQGGDIDVDLGVLQYTQAIGIAGKQSGLFAILPAGEVSGRLKPPFDAIQGSSSGIGDLQLGGIVGLIGPPPLSPQEFATYKPGYTLGLLAIALLPTGQYDPDQLLNVGANRWALRIGTPMTWYLGDSYLDPGLTTFELQPSVTFFTDNNDPFGDARRVGQGVFYRLEAHATRNLNRAVWVSLDGVYLQGGETSTNGVDNRDAQRALELGGSLNVTFSPRVSLKLSYGEVVERNDDGPDGYMIRLIAAIVI
jgi:hypothetical protein